MSKLPKTTAQCQRELRKLEKLLAKEKARHATTLGAWKNQFAQWANAFDTLHCAFEQTVALLERTKFDTPVQSAKNKLGRPRKPGGPTDARELRSVAKELLGLDCGDPPKDRIKRRPKPAKVSGRRGAPRNDKFHAQVLAKVEGAKQRDGANYDAPYVKGLSNKLSVPESTIKYWLRQARDRK